MKKNNHIWVILLCLILLSTVGMGFTVKKETETEAEEELQELYIKTIDIEENELQAEEEQDLVQSLGSKIDLKIPVFTLIAGEDTICYFKTSGEILDILDSLTAEYSQEEENTTVKEVKILEEIDILKEEVYLEDVKSKDQVLQHIKTGGQELKAHTVEEDEDFFTLSKTFNMTIEDLKELNPEKDGTALKAGEDIIVKQEKPLITVATTSEIESIKKTDYEILVKEDPEMFDTESKLEVQGQAGENKLITKEVKENGKVIHSELISEEVVKEPVDQVTIKGTKKKPKTVATGSFQMPTRGRLTSSFGSRWGRMHNGIDIAKPTGASIVAADGGKVSFSGPKGTYGNMIEIDHGNGLKTRYAHASKLLLKAGQRVAKGQEIAKVGNTGRSTGPHLHFEVLKNGVYQNPHNYVK